MKKFEYKIKTESGDIFTNVVDAISRQELLKSLKAKKYSILTIKEIKENFLYKLNNYFVKDKLSKELELEFFINIDLYISKMGLNINKALLHMSRNNSTNKILKNFSHVLYVKLDKGVSFPNALLQHGFDKDICEIINSGIQTGEMKETFKIIVEKGKLEKKTNKSLKILIIPMVTIITSGFIVLYSLLKFVFPKSIKNTLSIVNNDIEKLSIYTRIAIDLSKDIDFYMLILIGTLSTFIIVFYICYKKIKSFRIFLSKNFVKIPIVGSFLYFKENNNLINVLRLGIGSGFKYNEVVLFAKKQIVLPHFEEKINKVYDLVNRKGFKLSEAMELTQFDYSIYTTIERGELVDRKEHSRYLKDLNEFYVESIFENIEKIAILKRIINLFLLITFVLLPIIMFFYYPIALEPIMLM